MTTTYKTGTWDQMAGVGVPIPIPCAGCATPFRDGDEYTEFLDESGGRLLFHDACFVQRTLLAALEREGVKVDGLA